MRKRGLEGSDRKRLEQLCRYTTQPELSDERVQLNAAGQYELKLKTRFRDGNTHLVMSPQDMRQRGVVAATSLSPDHATRQRPVVSVS